MGQRLTSTLSISYSAISILFFCLFAHPPCHGADAPPDLKFHGNSIPQPPESRLKWVAPSEPKLLADIAGLFFGQGMADPRGCEYRQIKVMSATAWGNQDDGQGWKPDGTPIQTHGWVLPASEKNQQRFAVCWNGWVYPVLAVGEPCSVDEDVGKQLQLPGNDNHDLEFRTIFLNWGTIPDIDSLSSETPLPIKALLLMRLGKPQLASAVWEAFYKRRDPPNNVPPKDLGTAYENVATMWLFSLFNRATCAQMRGDDDLALLSFRQLAAVTPDARKTHLKLRGPLNPRRMDDRDPFNFLDQVPNYLADMERRHLEPPHKSALELGRGAFPSEAAWVHALVADLEDVTAPQDGQPGPVMLEQNATVKALILEGNAAVDPLIDCLAHDNRLTRSIFFWRDFAPNRTIVATYEAACFALHRIFGLDYPMFFGATGGDLTNRGPAERAQAVAELQAYWEKRKGASLPEQWLTTLVDDTAKPADWANAAENIAKSGQFLRNKKNPDVTSLLENRLKSVLTDDALPIPSSMPGPRLANALLTWDGTDAAGAVEEYCNGLADQCASGKHTGDAEPLIALTTRLAQMGYGKILEDYAGWLQRVPPKNLAERAGPWWHVADWFQPLWDHSDSTAMQKADSNIFGGKNSPWPQFIRENLGNYQEAIGMIRSPLIGMPAFRALILDGLADQTLAGEDGYLVGNFWMAQFGFGKNGRQVSTGMDPLDPLAKTAPGHGVFRTCDLYAWILSGVPGMPALEFYWPQDTRDTAIETSVQSLRRYGDRYRPTAQNPPRRYSPFGPGVFLAQLSFPLLAKPATQQDVENGLAIFSLPADANGRTWRLPQRGAKVRWLAIKDRPRHAANTDLMGRQWITTEYANEGRVWQAEEGYIDGKWQRFFGIAGDNYIARAPAEEVEFPARRWEELDGGFDCQLASDDSNFAAPLEAGAPIPLTLSLRNRRGIDQNAPASLCDSTGKSLASGVDIHLYHLSEPAPDQIEGEAAASSTTGDHWTEVTPTQMPHFEPPPAVHKLAPTEEMQVMSFKLGDFYELKTAGRYVAEITFDKGKLKFAGGTSEQLGFSIK
jgi:hypothetical protein